MESDAGYHERLGAVIVIALLIALLIAALVAVVFGPTMGITDTTTSMSRGRAGDRQFERGGRNQNRPMQSRRMPKG